MSAPIEERDFSTVVKKVASGAALDRSESEAAFDAIMRGEASDVALAAFLTALHVRGETLAELEGAVHAVRRHMTVLSDTPENSIDVCGTGGDGLGTLNVSTAVAFVLAGLGVPVAKHGNRALSSRSGATDVLECLGIGVNDDLAAQKARLRDHALIFLAAPVYHPAMRHAAPVRKALGFRTIFNLLGPMCNPAQVSRQLVGVFDRQWCDPVARTLGTLGSARVWAVHGETDEGGSDELTLAGPTHVAAWEEGRLLDLVLTPEMAGFAPAPISEIRGADAQYNASALHALLQGAHGPYRDTVLYNAGVALHVAGRGHILHGCEVDPAALRANIALAASSIDAGHALGALETTRNAASPNVKPLPIFQENAG